MKHVGTSSIIVLNRAFGFGVDDAGYSCEFSFAPGEEDDLEYVKKSWPQQQQGVQA